MPLDYETLRVIWWLLLGLLLIGFAVTDGFDLGVAIWLPWIGKTDIEKRVLINSIAPTWEGNQVWFILSGGAIFAAWPMLYAVSFSGLYVAMFLVLLSLILRPVGFKYRSKVDKPQWRAGWDIALFLSGFLPPLLFGVAIGNVLQGIPFHLDDSLRPFYTGTFWALLNPFALLSGLLSVSMLAMHGAFFLNVKTQDTIQIRAVSAARKTSFLTTVLFIAGGFWVYYNIDGYHLVGVIAHDGPSNPLYKHVMRTPFAWFQNYQTVPLTILIPVSSILAALLAFILAKYPKTAFVLSGLSVSGIIATVGVSMFPFILPSSSNPAHSLMVWDSSSSQLTLFIMLIATVIFLPMILMYTTWVYRVLRGKVTEKTVLNEKASY